MDTNIKQLIGGGVLALLLTACGGGSSGGGAESAGNSPTPSTRDLPEEMAAVVDQSNAFTEELCPETSEGSAGTPIDPELCVQESEESDGGAPDPTDVVAQFCPTAAASFDLQGAFDPAAFTEGFDDPAGFLTDGPLSFPVACLQESATNLDGLQDLIGGSNPITEQLCPVAAMEPSFDPATCFAEVTGGANGGLPGLPGGGEGGEGGGGVPGADQFLTQFCPDSAGAGVGPETPLNCLNEASRVYITIVDMITNPNPVTEAICPEETMTGRVDPVVCFEEAVGGGAPSLPGLGDLPGLPGLPGGGDGGDGGTPDVPGLDQLTDALSGICPDTLEAEVGPTTPIDCLAEAGGSFGGFEDLIGGLGGSNPLTEALCPTAATAESFDPAACFTEATQQLPSAPGGGTPQIPGVGMALEQICPVAAGEEIGPTTPFDCLLELGGGFGDLEGLLGGLAGGDLGGSNPLTEALCPVTSEEGLDPAACFMEALEGLPGGLPLPGGDGGDTPEIPGADQLLGQLCPVAGAGEVGLTTPIECLTEAGQNLGDLQDMLGGLGGSNPLTEAVCPVASGAEQLDPAACLTEALGALPGAPGGGDGGGVPEIPGLSDGLAQLCPEAGAGELGPTTPIACLTEAGQNLGGLTDLLGGLGGSNPLTEALCPAASTAEQLDPAACFTEALGNLPGAPGGDGGGVPEIPGLSDGLAQICPVALEGEVGPTTPLDCLMEAGGSLGQLQDLLGGLGGGLGGGEDGGEGGGDPVTSQLCPEAGAGGLSPTLPIECLLEAGQNLPDLLTGLLGGLAP